MTNEHRIANRKSILKATQEDVRTYRMKAREAHSKINALMLEVMKDPTLATNRATLIGLYYMDQERFLNLEALSKGTCLALRQEINDLKTKA